MGVWERKVERKGVRNGRGGSRLASKLCRTTSGPMVKGSVLFLALSCFELMPRASMWHEVSAKVLPFKDA